MKLCKQCKIKSGFDFIAKGCHTVQTSECDSCGQVEAIWPDRFFKPHSKNPKTRNSYSSCVNKIMNEQQLKLKDKLEREGVLTWQEIDKAINELNRESK